MCRSTAGRSTFLEWGAAWRAFPGQAECGDRHVVRATDTAAIVAVLDGLGHGPAAAEAAAKAVAVIDDSLEQDPAALVRRCHEKLLRTRGAVLSLASFAGAGGGLTWLGVGNVDGVLVRGGPARASRREWLASRGGVVGYQLPSLRPAHLEVEPGDVLVLATDGIRRGFTDHLAVQHEPEEIAARLVRTCAREDDDALVLAVRHTGATR